MENEHQQEFQPQDKIQPAEPMSLSDELQEARESFDLGLAIDVEDLFATGDEWNLF